MYDDINWIFYFSNPYPGREVRVPGLAAGDERPAEPLCAGEVRGQPEGPARPAQDEVVERIARLLEEKTQHPAGSF